MARTYSNTPEPRYVELAKRSVEGSKEEIFNAIFGTTTYQEIHTAANAGKIVLLKNADGTDYIAGIPINDLTAYVFSVADSTGTINIIIVDEDGWRVETIAEIFWVTFEQTTFAEIREAYNAGKLCVLKGQYDGSVLTQCIDALVLFARNSHNDVQEIECYSNDTWSVASRGVESIFFCEPNSTDFVGIVEAVQAGCLPVINDIANGRCYYVSGYTLSNGDPVAIRFCTLEKDDLGLKYVWDVDYQDNWMSSSYTDGLYYVTPGSTTFMEIVGLLTKCTQPVINDTVNGRAYYISDYTMVGGQPAAITFSTIGANTPHTWTVDYQDNWSST